MREIALDLAQAVAAEPAAAQVNFDWVEPAREVRIRIDQDEARLLGLSSEAVASVLNTVIIGRAGDPGPRRHLSRQRGGAGHRRAAGLAHDLPTLQVPLPNGRTVPLSQLATFEYARISR